MMQLEGEFLHVLREVLTPACLFWFSEMGSHVTQAGLELTV